MTRFEDMQQLITTLAAQHKQTVTEVIPLDAACGRVLAQPIQALVSIPRFDVSAMDGYAIATGTTAVCLPVVGESIAGKAYSGEMLPNTCIRIMTGAVVPQGCDRIVMQENVSQQPSTSLAPSSVEARYDIKLNQAIALADNIRIAGEELTAGEVLMQAGQCIYAADMMLLASVGVASLAVYRPLRVAVLSCGDELVEVGQPLFAEAIYESNRVALKAQLAALPVIVHDYGIVPDDIAQLETVLTDAAQTCDVVISSAGVSAGDYDYMRTVIGKLGRVEQYKVAMKPGKPFVLGQIGQAIYFGLPGNPVASFVCFNQLVKSALWQMSGVIDIPQPLRFKAQLTHAVRKRAGRMDFQRAHIAAVSDVNATSWYATPIGVQDSHRVAGLSRANGYIILPIDAENQPVGAWVDVELMT